jgi:hypothetical protein
MLSVEIGLVVTTAGLVAPEATPHVNATLLGYESGQDENETTEEIKLWRADKS